MAGCIKSLYMHTWTQWLLLSFAAVYLSLENRNFANNTEFPISNITEDLSSRLTCHTDLTECCRAKDTGTVAMGEWYYPSGRVIPKQDVGDNFYRVRDAPQLIRLSHRGGTLGPTGSYCCVIPTTEGEMTICANIGQSDHCSCVCMLHSLVYLFLQLHVY